MVSTLVIPVITVATPYAVNILDGESCRDVPAHPPYAVTKQRARAVHPLRSHQPERSLCRLQDQGGFGGLPQEKKGEC